MASGLERLRELLDDAGVDYLQLQHRRDFRAVQTAADTHTPVEEFAKTVFVWIDGEPAMVVLPADKQLSPSKLRKAVAGRTVRVANEVDTKQLCPDCEVGAAPPFGMLYGLPVFASRSLERDEEITFNAGSHDHALRMKLADWVRLVKPRIVALAKRD
jgi:Ala-tRNA(Pro) deacylase